MPRDNISQDALSEANRTRNSFSGYQNALGASGYRDQHSSVDKTEFLATPGEMVALTPGPEGFGEIYVGCSWNIRAEKDMGLLGRLFKRTKQTPVDLDLGCLYELQDGTKGALQAFGDAHGSYDAAPFISLSHDERTGIADGDDEFLHISGTNWPAIKRALIYVYIYDGAVDWSRVRPQVQLRIPGQPVQIVRPQVHLQSMGVCAAVMLENVRNGMKITNLTEYFPAQPELDRAYGFGNYWGEGSKESA